MKSLQTRIFLLGLLLTCVIAAPSIAQIVIPNDDTTLKQIIVFGRHSVRSSTDDTATLDQYSADPSPGFPGVPKGYLTPRGREAARLLGSYFNLYLLNQGLLSGSNATDLNRVYFRANSIQRSNITASFFGTGLIPGATVPVHSYSLGTTDPVFDPVAAGVATVDPDRALAEVQGYYGTAAALGSALSGEMSLIHNVIYPQGTAPIFPPGSVPPQGAPPAAQGSYDPTTIATSLTKISPVTVTGGSMYLGGINYTGGVIDPFIMQYADNFAMSDVAWGRMTPEEISQATRVLITEIQIAMRLPYVAQAQSSNAASHILRSMQQFLNHTTLRGSFGTTRTPILVVISSDYYVAGLAGLLGLHWTLPGYQPDYCAPGGALVFELRQSNTTKEHLVRIYYTAQTLDQLRNLTSMNLDNPPATMQLYVPGGGSTGTSLDVKWQVFKRIMTNAIDQSCVQPYGREVPPPVIQNVPLD